MKLAACLSVTLLAAGAAYGQPPKTVSGFEIADVQASPLIRNPYRRGPFRRAERYEVRQATMVDLISLAYGVEPDKVLEGPIWLEMDRFDIIAKAPAGAKQDALKGLLQGTLAERFHLKLHTETRPLPAFALTVGKKLLLKKSAGSDNSGCKESVSIPPPEPGGGRGAPMLDYACRNTTIAELARNVRFTVTAPVVDQTGLEGTWDFEVKLPFTGLFMPGAEPGPSVADAIEKQLGLKLAAVSLPQQVVVVEAADRKPTDDGPDVAAFLKATAPPTEFEVADIKPSAPGGRGMGTRNQPGGRVTMSGITVQNMILRAWNLTPDMLVGAPKWLNDDRYDIVAKAPSSIVDGEGPADAGAAPVREDVDMDTVWVMMRALLADRFRLVVHEEEQPMQAYTLVAVKPKMKRADPKSRTRFTEGPGADGKDPRNATPANGRLITAQNVTMAQFAERLQSLAGGYVHSPVLDATGLDGAYDFTLNFTPAGMVGMAGGGRGGARGGVAIAGSSDPVGEASEPNGAISLPEAIEKQLGLKLELRKRPVKVLVIDKVERTPTEN